LQLDLIKILQLDLNRLAVPKEVTVLRDISKFARTEWSSKTSAAG